jgi:hypothetical protein
MTSLDQSEQSEGNNGPISALILAPHDVMVFMRICALYLLYGVTLDKTILAELLAYNLELHIDNMD